MPYCIKCGKETSDKQRFCAGCGHPTGNTPNLRPQDLYTGFYEETLTSVVQTNDGGYLVTYTAESEDRQWDAADVLLIRTNAEGDIIWSRTFGTEGY